MLIGLFLRANAKPIKNHDDFLIIEHVEFLVDGDKFAATLGILKARGVAVEGPEDTGIAYSAFFNDPDGHTLEVTTYHS
ncbi:MAG: hypothetical protein EOS82_24050 [Mesorhizobium sp.]|uniref:VOC family protein n=1 Tax=Mesorhizobium sp. TaxID=1871066 RepID=UPI000FE5B25B|nr:MAG: hypothetical protein EOS82_24050 [Mesorhizobium sp.]